MSTEIVTEQDQNCVLPIKMSNETRGYKMAHFHFSLGQAQEVSKNYQLCKGGPKNYQLSEVRFKEGIVKCQGIFITLSPLRPNPIALA